LIRWIISLSACGIESDLLNAILREENVSSHVESLVVNDSNGLASDGSDGSDEEVSDASDEDMASATPSEEEVSNDDHVQFISDA
jgi:hypothetical protein